MTTQESDRRLGELILFICQKSANDTYFGATKLNKLLYYSDFLAYARWGKTITGAEYWNLPEGPAPKRLVQVRDALFSEKPQALAIQQIQFPSYIQKRPVQLRPPDLSLFRGDELTLVEDVIEEHRGFTARQIRDKSHHEWGWILTKEGETIEPETILLSPDTEKLSDKEIDQILGAVSAK
jgi:uncharacterized phage-associated protein